MNQTSVIFSQGQINRYTVQSGVALISVLVTVTIILVTLSSLFYRNQLDVARATYGFTKDQAVLLALSSENWWLQILAEDLISSESDNLTETWAYPSPTMPVENGQLTACLIDLQSRLNVNNLLRYQVSTIDEELQKSNFGAAVQLFRLFSQLEYANAFERISTLHDWIDLDSSANRNGGAEDAQYLRAETPRYAANSPLTSIDELPAISQFELADLSTLEAYLSALPKATSVNINTSSTKVLSVILNEFDENTLQDIIDYRPYENIDDFYQRLVDLNYADTIAEMQDKLSTEVVSVSSDFFQLNSIVELGDVRFVVQSLIYRPADAESRILQRKLLSMPKLQDTNGKVMPIPQYCTTPNVEDFLS